MVNRKLNVKRLGIFCVIVLVIILTLVFVISGYISDAKMRKTSEFRLGEVGYTDNEIKVITKSLNKEQIEKIISSKYKKNLTKFIKEKYFIYDNLERYLDYASSNPSTEATKVVSIVNSKADTEWYSNIKETDTSKGELMLVNKFYGLKENYEPEDLITVSETYAYKGKKVSKVMYDYLTDMLDSAKSSGYTLVVSQGYRSYADQEEAYKGIQNSSGASVADRQAARPGHSEYQTGLSIIVEPYNKVVEDVSQSEEHSWLINNCHRFGFILRYPEGTSEITGFSTDNWRLRFVGVDAATKIHNEGITFDEYYAYYVNK